LNPSHPFTDHNIRQTIDALIADGQNVTAWAVQSRLGGGDFARIQQIIDQIFPAQHKQSPQNISPAMQFTADNGALKKPHTAQQFSPPPRAADIIDKQMPTGIEASMYQMQTSLGQMANQIWSDAAENAEGQVRDKLFSAQQAHADAVQAQTEAEAANKKMQTTVSRLTAELDELDTDHNQALSSLKEAQASLQETQTQRDTLLKNVATLETENQGLEQTAFNSNIKAAKAEGLSEIIKEQLSLAKQSEKQIQKELDRSEKKVNELNTIVHNTSQSLRDEMRDRQVPLHPQKRPQTTPPASPQQYPAQKLPQPNAANIPSTPPTPAQNPAVEQPPAPAGSYQGKVIKDLGHSLVMNRSKNVSPAKTRSLSDKLFARKKKQPNTNDK
jgi:hypothetical protein